jgi:hypothetical protein
MPEITVRSGYPDFIDLPWEHSITTWDPDRFVVLPKGISRHEVRFHERDGELFAIKELPERAARTDYEVLRALDDQSVPTVKPVGLVLGRTDDRHDEGSAALITVFEPYSFALRSLVSGPDFGPRRSQILDAFAGLLSELHLAGCFWGDGSLSNVLYRFDAETVMAVMVDAETAELHEVLSDGQRENDLAIMIENVAGGMADIATSQGAELDEADLWLGEDIADRYRALWSELTEVSRISPEERWRFYERVKRLNELGFEVDEVEVVADPGRERLRMRPLVGSREFHSHRLASLTGIEALEFQARQILSDVNYHIALGGERSRQASALSYRVEVFEPWVQRLRATEGVVDPVQAFCDLLVMRYELSAEDERAVPTDEAYEVWVASGRPGYPLEGQAPQPEPIL